MISRNNSRFRRLRVPRNGFEDEAKREKLASIIISNCQRSN